MVKKKAFNKFDKPKNVFPKPEHIVIGDSYAFNWNPSTQPNMLKVFGFAEWYHHYSTGLEKLQHCSIQTVVEISSTGRFHFHGEIIFHSHAFYWTDIKYLTEAGTCVIKKIDDADTWNDYLNKQQEFMQPFMEAQIFTEDLKLLQTYQGPTSHSDIIPSADQT